MSREDDTAAARRELVVVLLLTAAFVAYFLTLCVQKWRAYGYGDFDLAIFDQAVWGTSRGHGLFPSSIRFGSVFADHVPVILLGAVPLYWALDSLVPGALILLALQAVAVGSAAVPLHLLARRMVGPFAGVAVAAAYLLHPATGYLVLFEFHPGALAVPFLCWMLWALHARRWRSFLVFAALALACREDVALPVAMTGLYALWREWRDGRPVCRWQSLRWGVVPAAAALVWFLVAVLVVVPSAQPVGDAGGVTPFIRLYAFHLQDAGVIEGWPVPEVAGALLGSPLDAIGRAARFKPVGEYTWHLLAPTGGLAVVSPVALLPALPTWFLNVTSVKAETSSICYQYTANLLPFLFLATASSMAWLGRVRVLRGRPWLLPAVLVASALASTIAWGKQAHPHTDPLDAVHRPDAPHQLYATAYARDEDDVARDALLTLVPEDASLVTTFAFLGKASSRETLHSWHYVRVRTEPVSGAAVQTPPCDYVLLDASDPLTFGAFGDLGSGERQRTYLRDHRVVARAGALVLLRRGGEGAGIDELAHVVEPSPEGLEDRQGTGIVLRSWELDTASSPPPVLFDAGLPMPVLRVSWASMRPFWEMAARATSDFHSHGTLWVRVQLTGANGIRRETVFALSHGLHPISEWRPFDPAFPHLAPTTVRASYPLLVPTGTWSVRVTVDSTHLPRDVPLATFDLGDVDVP